MVAFYSKILVVLNVQFIPTINAHLFSPVMLALLFVNVLKVEVSPPCTNTADESTESAMIV